MEPARRFRRLRLRADVSHRRGGEAGRDRGRYRRSARGLARALSRAVRWGLGVMAGAGLIVLLFAAFPWGLLAAHGEAPLSRVLGRNVRIGSARRADWFSLRPTVELRDVTVSQPAGFGAGPMVLIARADARFEALPLLLGRFHPARHRSGGRADTVAAQRRRYIQLAERRRRGRRGGGGRQGDDRAPHRPRYTPGPSRRKAARPAGRHRYRRSQGRAGDRWQRHASRLAVASRRSRRRSFRHGAGARGLSIRAGAAGRRRHARTPARLQPVRRACDGGRDGPDLSGRHRASRAVPQPAVHAHRRHPPDRAGLADHAAGRTIRTNPIEHRLHCFQARRAYDIERGRGRGDAELR